MRNTYLLTYSIPGGKGGNVNTIYGETMEEAIDITFGLYKHIKDTGVITKKTEKETIIKAEAADMQNPTKIYKYTYKLTKNNGKTN